MISKKLAILPDNGIYNVPGTDTILLARLWLGYYVVYRTSGHDLVCSLLTYTVNW